MHSRFNQYALSFLQQVLEKLLNNKIDPTPLLTIAKNFNRVLIKDSVCFQIDESLADSYPGSGGCGSSAAVRIQFEYDLLNGHINDLSVNAFNDQDSTNSIDTLELTQQGDLIIRDLAYINLKVLKELLSKGAYFLSRLQYNVDVYEKAENGYQKLTFAKLRTSMIKNNLTVIEKEVYLGYHEKLKVRLIIHLLPNDVVAERLRKAVKNNKKKGTHQLSANYKARAALNLFITNASKDQIPMKTVCLLYRLRWQIELMFKIWKSLCHIDKVKKVKKERLQCYLYGKLIFITLSWRIILAVAKFHFHKEKKAISYFKSFKTMLRTKIEALRKIILLKTERLDQFMIDFYTISNKKHLLEKKQQKMTSIQLLITCLN